MDISSTITTSASSGLSSSRAKPWPSPPYSSSRCSVRAEHPVASLMRLAARPVGAQSSTRPMRRIRRMMQLMDVVLPVPGPPVTTVTPSVTAASTALRCSPQRATFSSRSYSAISARIASSLWGAGSMESRSASSSFAVSRSASSRLGRYTARSPPTSSRTSARRVMSTFSARAVVSSDAPRTRPAWAMSSPSGRYMCPMPLAASEST